MTWLFTLERCYQRFNLATKELHAGLILDSILCEVGFFHLRVHSVAIDGRLQGNPIHNVGIKIAHRGAAADVAGLGGHEL